jgi:hypothetical protein
MSKSTREVEFTTAIKIHVFTPFILLRFDVMKINTLEHYQMTVINTTNTILLPVKSDFL